MSQKKQIAARGRVPKAEIPKGTRTSVQKTRRPGKEARVAKVATNEARSAGASGREGLTPKQKAFCDEYLMDLNATQAAIRAGYSARTAEQQAARLLRNVKARAYVKELMDQRSKHLQTDADWVLRRLVQEAEADLADLFTAPGALKPVGQWPEIWRGGLVASLDVETRENGDVTAVKIRLSDRIKRIELIGRHVNVGAFKDRVEHDITDRAAELIAARKRLEEGSCRP